MVRRLIALISTKHKTPQQVHQEVMEALEKDKSQQAQPQEARPEDYQTASEWQEEWQRTWDARMEEVEEHHRKLDPHRNPPLIHK